MEVELVEALVEEGVEMRGKEAAKAAEAEAEALRKARCRT